MSIYRKIYEQHFGEIPKDVHGRSYEIHHVDGDRTNNDISNLKCVSIQEHYDIHYSQGDWGACHRIADRMRLPFEVISELAKKFANDRVTNGVHNFQNSHFQRKFNAKRASEGTHNFQKEKVKNKVRKRNIKLNNEKILQGSHPFQNQKQVTCPHCGKTGANGIMNRFHLDRCKFKDI